MSWAIGYDTNWERDIGYGVPAVCDHPDCSARIDRGLSYVCGNQPFGGAEGCGLYFCPQHQRGSWQHCEMCATDSMPFDPKPDLPEWIKWKLTHKSWKRWRKEHPEEVAKMKEELP